jgi:hypothetical protein
MDEVFDRDGEITMADWRFTAALGVAHIRECIDRCSFTHHANTNVTIELDGDRAHAVTYVRAWHCGGPGESQTLECIGQYVDEFVRTPSGWRILQRDEQVRVIHGDFSIFAGLEQKRDRLLAESAAHFAARRGSGAPGN